MCLPTVTTVVRFRPTAHSPWSLTLQFYQLKNKNPAISAKLSRKATHSTLAVLSVSSFPYIPSSVLPALPCCKVASLKPLVMCPEHSEIPGVVSGIAVAGIIKILCIFKAERVHQKQQIHYWTYRPISQLISCYGNDRRFSCWIFLFCFWNNECKCIILSKAYRSMQTDMLQKNAENFSKMRTIFVNRNNEF